MKTFNPKEFKAVALRECPVPESLQMCDTPEKAAEYWQLHVATNPYFNSECECFVVLLLNTRRRVKGHQLLTIARWTQSSCMLARYFEGQSSALRRPW